MMVLIRQTASPCGTVSTFVNTNVANAVVAWSGFAVLVRTLDFESGWSLTDHAALSAYALRSIYERIRCVPQSSTM